MMTLDRLNALADAFGGDLRRWPATDRAAAEQLLAIDPAARAVLDAALALDAVLSTSPRPQASAALRDRVIDAARRAGLRPQPARRFWLDRLVLASGAGWAAAACAGVIAGLSLTTHMTADVQADAVLYQATLAGVDDTEVLG
jgi:anti-sigma factor RsiW